MFTREEREQIRAALVSAAQEDPKVTGAAHLGSAAADRLDDWSDVDLALCISAEGELEEVIAACHPSSLDTEELHRALHRTMTAFLTEIRLRDSDVAERIGPTLLEVARRDVDGPVAPAAGAL